MIDNQSRPNYPYLMSTPGEQLITELDNLRQHLTSLQQRLEKSGTARTRGLLDFMGTDCHFYQKSMDLFLDKDYQDLKNMIDSINNLFSLIEGKYKQ